MSDPTRAGENLAHGVPSNVGAGSAMPHIENPYLRQPLPKDKDRVNWRQDITGTTEAKRLPVDLDEGMPKDVRQDFIQIIFDRYKKMSEHYVAPKPGENAPVRQQLDDWSEWLIKEIAAENGFSEFPPGNSEARVVEYIEDHLQELDLANLHADTRNAAYFVVVGTEMEMMASAAVAGRNVANMKRDFVDTVRYAAQGLVEKVSTSDKVLDVIAFFDPTLSVPEFRSRWKERQRRSHITAYNPVSKGYDSAYMKAIGFDGLDSSQRGDLLAKVEHARSQFAYACTGVDLHSPLWDQMNGIIQRAENGNYKKSLDPRQNLFVEMLSSVLQDERGKIKLESLSVTERTPVLLEAATRAIARAADEQADGILHRTAENAFSSRNVAKVNEKLRAIETDPAKVKDKAKDESVTLLGKRVGEVTTAQRAWKTAYEAVDSTRKGHDKERLRLDKEEATLTLQRTEANGKLGGLTGGAYAAMDAVVKNLDAQLAKIAADKLKIPAPADPIPEEKALELSVSEVKAKLTGFAEPADILKIILTAPPPPHVEENELNDFLLVKQTALNRETEEAKLASDKLLRVAEWRKLVGPEVLRVILEESNDIVADFIHGRQGSVRTWEEFVDKLQLEQSLNEEVRVLTPDRLAKLLVTYLGIEDIDPGDIKNPLLKEGFNSDQIKERQAEFDRYWAKIMKSFWKLDGFSRGKVVLEIYGDRFNSLLRKADPSADVIKYRRPEKAGELIERQTEPEAFIGVLETEGIHMGVDAIVDAAGDYILVGRDGDVQVYEVEELQDNERRLQQLGPLGIIKRSSNIEYDNPALPPETMRSLFAEMASRSIAEELLAAPLGTRINITGTDGNNRRISRVGPRAQDVVVDRGPEVTAAGGPIPLQRFADYSTQLDEEFQNRGGGRMLDRLETRSDNLDTLNEFKQKGIGEKVDPRKVPDEISWIDGKDELSAYYVILNDTSGIQIEHRKRTSTSNPFLVAADFIDGVVIGDPKINLNKFKILTNAQDKEALRRKLPAAAYDLLLQMPPEQREMLHLDPIGVDISVPGVIDDRISVSVDTEGQIIARASTGDVWLLSELLNRAVASNQPPNPRYDRVGSSVAAKMKQENLKIQSAVGEEVLKKLHRLRRVQ